MHLDVCACPPWIETPLVRLILCFSWIFLNMKNSRHIMYFVRECAAYPREHDYTWDEHVYVWCLVVIHVHTFACHELEQKSRAICKSLLCRAVAMSQRQLPNPSTDASQYVSITPDNKLLKRIVKDTCPSDIESARPQKGDKVEGRLVLIINMIDDRFHNLVHYVGTLWDGGKRFDSSRDRPGNFSFTLGVGQVIKGWDIGVATMSKGEICELVCSPEYAYGESGHPPAIPPNAALSFEVELVDFYGEPSTDEEIAAHCQSMKTRANQSFLDGSMDDAHSLYNKALRVISKSKCQNSPGLCTLKNQLTLNLMTVCNKLGYYKETIGLFNSEVKKLNLLSSTGRMAAILFESNNCHTCSWMKIQKRYLEWPSLLKGLQSMLPQWNIC